MKIGIDARFLTHPQHGGFKTYTENLLNALSDLDRENQYILYLDRPPIEESVPQQPNFSYRVVDGTLPIVGMPVREQIRLRRQIIYDKPDVVHFLCNTASTGIAKKFVVTLHDTIQVTTQHHFKFNRTIPGHKRWAIAAYSNWAIRRSIQTAQKLITVSSYEKNQIEQHLDVASQRICVTPLAANPIYAPVSTEIKNLWRKEMEYKYGVNNRFILGVGYEDRKNIPLLIDAFAEVTSRQPDLRLFIVAAEVEKSTFFKQLVIERNLASRVNILPAMSPGELRKLYNLAELFVFPSERESFGLPPLEAIACGTPTIAMNMTSLPEVLADGALMINGKDTEQWANAIERVLTDNDLRSDLIHRGLKQAARLTWENCALNTIQVYESM